MSKDLVKKVVQMGNTGKSEHVEELVMLLSHSNGNVRRLTCSALGKIGDQKAQRHLAGMLFDEKPQVRQYAIKALGKLEGKYSLAALKAIAKDLSEKDYNRKAAREAVKKITGEKEQVGKEADQPEDIELNERFKLALKVAKEGKNLFLTGEAGTGKSTWLDYFHRNSKKQMAVLAPTGVAAINIRGQTIHSFFGFGPDITPSKVEREFRQIKNGELYEKLEVIVIDEISMVRADLLDCVERFLQMHGPKPRESFGGIQMIFVGDLYQLPPVVTGEERRVFEEIYQSPYFFDSNAFGREDFVLVQLEKMYRQEDDKFIGLLNSVRNRSIGKGELARLNKQVLKETGDDLTVHLTTTNAKAGKINERMLGKMKGERHVHNGVIRGEFDSGSLPARNRLELKPGAQVMLVSNDARGRWVNGTVGEVEGVNEKGDEVKIKVRKRNGKTVMVGRHSWEKFKYVYNEKRGTVESQVVGSFTQYPIILAWAITIHKSQGKTFERVRVDLGRGSFAHGQTYVALSRCSSLQGLSLARPMREKDILVDWRVPKFMASYQHEMADERLPLREKIELLKEACEKSLKVKMVYLKADDTKSEREVLPEEAGSMDYGGKDFLGVRGYCFLREGERVFRIDRILSMELKEGD